MKKPILFILAAGFAWISCGENKTSETESTTSEVTEQETSTATSTRISNTNTTSATIDAYMSIKDALVNDDSEKAKEESKTMLTALGEIDLSEVATDQKPEVENLIQNAISQTTKISNGEIEMQRDNFDQLSQTIKDLVEKVGADRTLYHQYCPMFKSNTGGMWLSESEDIKNPLFGSAMLTCGRVEDTLVL